MAAYHHLLTRDPDAAAQALRRIREAVVVILVVAQATRAVLDALQRLPAALRHPRARRRPSFDDETAHFDG